MVTCEKEHPVTQRVRLDELKPKERKLIMAAQEIALSDEAYNPNSGFFVGSAALTDTGGIITGVNVENAAYGSSICSERCALIRSQVVGKGANLVAIAIVARHKDGPTKKPTAPCGECRQVISEFAERSVGRREFRVIFGTTNLEQIEVATIEKLLPMAFGPNDLLS